MSVAHADDDDDENEVFHSEKVLCNGDFYTGQWLDNLPHRHGKYLWTDGCMYVGEWSKGKPMGRGKFSWPFGATYEGNFNNSYMDGKGTYTGSSGDTYRGFWVMNLKHGNGIMCFVVGDSYEGEWRHGLQDGTGKYHWRNGNFYIGQWKNGVIHGNGTMIWGNGNRYDGCWENGFPKGNGTFRWDDGSFYVGVWSKDFKEQNGTYYPPSDSSYGHFDWDPQEVFSVDLNDCQIWPDEKVSIFPSQKMLNWPGFEGEQNLMNGRVSNCSWETDSDVVSDTIDANLENLESLRIDSLGSKSIRPQRVRIQPVKRQGVTISKGHKNFDLMLNLQLGIRHSVGRPAPATSFDLKSSAFDPREKVWTKFPSEGSKHTPPHQSCEFKWKDYCPVVFRTLRKLFQVDPADYMISICGNDALRELSSPGKSGSFFYLTHDDKYMIKTMKKSETKVLLRMLPAYYNHVRAFEHTLVTKFFGLHCVKLIGAAQKKVRFVIMGNLFCSEYSIHRRFDLKGSSHGRTTEKPGAEIDPTTTLKDLDLNFLFRLQKVWFQDFCRQVDRDCEFLEQERIMDYSMLIGLHFRETLCFRETQVIEACPSVVCTPKSYRTPTVSHTPTGSRTPRNVDFDNDGGGIRLTRSDMDQQFLDPERWASIRLGVNMPTRVEQTVRRADNETRLIGEPTGEFYEVVLFFGIIDILQDYDISKKLEHAYKSMQYDPTSISAVDPRQYSKRFRDFISKIFTEDT